MFNLLQTMEGYGDRIAMKSLNGEDSFEVSYKDYLKAIQYCAYNLQQELGDITGKHIGLVCKSNYEYTVMLAAIIYSRAVAVPINTFESDDNISYIVEDSDVIAVIVDEELEEKVLVDIKKVYQKDIISKKEKAIELKDFTEEEIDNPIFIIYKSYIITSICY